MNERQLLRTAPGPWVRSGLTTGSIMFEVVLALLPAAFFGVWRFGTHALLLLLAGVLSAVTTEYALDCFLGRENTLRDGSAALTGLLLALSLPPDVPVILPFLGAAVAVAIVKGLAGGLGKNRLNPALTARCLLAMAFAKAMTGYGKAAGLTAAAAAAAPGHMLIGSLSGVIGGSVIALLLGGVYLIAAGVISWRVPVSALIGYFVFALLFGGEASAPAQLLFFLAQGGMLALFFMATDPVTSPVSRTGKCVYGALIGLTAVLLQKLLAPAEAVCGAVLIANLFSPLIDRTTVPRPRV